jgi:hypothetical protein
VCGQSHCGATEGKKTEEISLARKNIFLRIHARRSGRFEVLGPGVIDQLIHRAVEPLFGAVFAVGFHIQRAVRHVTEAFQSVGEVTGKEISAPGGLVESSLGVRHEQIIGREAAGLSLRSECSGEPARLSSENLPGNRHRGAYWALSGKKRLFGEALPVIFLDEIRSDWSTAYIAG